MLEEADVISHVLPEERSGREGNGAVIGGTERMIDVKTAAYNRPSKLQIHESCGNGPRVGHNNPLALDSVLPRDAICTVILRVIAFPWQLLTSR